MEQVPPDERSPRANSFHSCLHWVGRSGLIVVMVALSGWTQLAAQEDGASRGFSNPKQLEGADANVVTVYKSTTVDQMQAYHLTNPNFKKQKGPAKQPPPPQAVDEKGLVVAARDGDSPQVLGEPTYREGLEPGSVAGVAAAPPLSQSFQGVIDNLTVIPPDTMGAVGPNHIVEFLNSGFTVFNRTGGLVVPQISLQAFWSSLGVGAGQPASNPFDPKVLYDQYSDRWVVVSDSVDGTSAWVLVGISQTNDPTGLWNLYGIRSNNNDGVVNHGNDFSDFPGVGLDPNNVIITNNMFSRGGFFIHADVWVISKASLIAGAGALTQGTDYAVLHNPCNTGGFTFQPCHTFGQTTATAVNYILDERWIDGATRTRRFIRVKQISGVGANAILACSGGNDWIEVAPYNLNKLNGSQPSCATRISTGPTHLLNAVWRNGKVWTTHGVGIGSGITDTAPPSRAQVAWYEINPAAIGAFPGGVPNQQGHVSDSALYYSYPSIAVNKDECVALGFSGGSGTTFISSFYTARFATDSPGMMRTVARLHDGQGHYFKQFGGSRNRWGDYSAMMVDPVDDETFWTVQEHAAVPSGSPTSCASNSGRWGTWWGAIRCVPGPEAKFSQPPTTDGENIASNIDWVDDLPNVVVADDFISDGRPITGVRWWGGQVDSLCDPNETGQCTDGVDNDCDSLTDCADSDCAMVPACNLGGGLLFASEPSGTVGLAGKNLGVIDPSTGTFTIVGPFTGAAGPVTEIQWSPDGSTLNAMTGGGTSRLHTVDPTTGAILTSVTQSIVGALNGCEFDASETLLCTLVTSGGGTSQSNLVGVDPVTGVVTVIGATGFANIGGLAFDESFTTLYGITSGGGAVPPILLSINPSTGLATSLTTVMMTTEASSLAFLLDGRLVTAGADGVFYWINLANGAATAIGPLVNAAKLSGLSVQPRVIGGPPADDCNAAPIALDGTVSFDTTGTTTDGPAASCAPLENDVWVDYVASCDGTATINTIGSAFDTVLEVYAGCSCNPLGSIVACNDDAAGLLQSIVSFPVTAGECFKVRVGGFAGDQGAGLLNIACTSCPAAGPCELASSGFEGRNFCEWTATSNGLSEFFPWRVGAAGTSTGFHLSSPLTGSFDALNGFDGAAGLRYELFQDVALPAGGAISLTTNHRIQYNSLGIASTLPREFDISIRSTSNAILSPLFHQEVFVNLASNTDLGWNRQVFDISAFAGQTVRIHFEVFIPESFTGPAMIEFDDIILSCTIASNAPDSLDVATLNRTTAKRITPGSHTQRPSLSFDVLCENYLTLRERSLMGKEIPDAGIAVTAAGDVCPMPDGWFIGFHEPIDPVAPPRPALGLYYCDNSVVRQAGVGLSTCNIVQVIEHTIDLNQCCLIHADVDPRSGLVPATADGFFEQKCFDYAIDIQAVYGHRFVDVDGVCVEEATGTTLGDDCWGWHTTTISRGDTLGLGPAQTSSISMDIDQWLFGPWDAVTPTCSSPNMAFELLTDVQDGPADADGNGIADDCERLGDFDIDADRDLIDYGVMFDCMFGPSVTPFPAPPLTAQDCLDTFDFDRDGDVDIIDWSGFQTVFTGP